MKSDQLEEETSVSKSFLLIFDYFIYFNKNIEPNLPKRKIIQKDVNYLLLDIIVLITRIRGLLLLSFNYFENFLLEVKSSLTDVSVSKGLEVTGSISILQRLHSNDSGRSNDSLN